MFLRTVTLIFGMTLSGAVALLMFAGCSQSTTVLSPQDTISEVGSKQSSSGDSIHDTASAPVREAPRRPTWEVEPAPLSTTTTEDVLVPLASELPPVVTSGQTYTVKKGDSLWAISHRYGISVPALAEANGLSKDATLKIGQTLLIPDGSDASVALHTVNNPGVESTNVDEAMTTYTVKKGDTLSKIAQRHGVKVVAIKSLNHLGSDTIRVGQKLYLPSASQSATMSQKSVPQAHVDFSGDTYQVQSGDTLSGIASRLKCTVSDLMDLNGMDDARSLRAGQVLKIPSGSANVAHTQPSSEPVTVIEEAAPQVTYEPEPVVPEGFGDDDALDLMDAAEVVPVE